MNYVVLLWDNYRLEHGEKAELVGVFGSQTAADDFLESGDPDDDRENYFTTLEPVRL